MVERAVQTSGRTSENHASASFEVMIEGAVDQRAPQPRELSVKALMEPAAGGV
jgi:hypothetical protein